VDRSNISSSKTGSVPIQITPGRGQDGEPAGAAGGGQDRIELSAAAQDFARAEEAVRGAGDLRFGLVSQLRADVRGGTYRVDAQAIAHAWWSSTSSPD
jgi:flagellar biosynthesis anti-sigma factor FlgM